MKNKYDFPLFRWHLELSSKCTLSCSRCTRTGPENKHKYRVNQLSLDFVKSVLSPEILKRSRYMLFCGVFGDPIYNNNLIEIVKYMKQANPNMYLYIVTNGSHKKSEWWKQLAEHLNEYDSVVFSVDGWDQESNNLYRTNSDFNSIIEAIKVMVKSRASVKWSTILFRFNQNKMNDIKDLAQSLGVNHFDLVKSTKFGSPWVAEGDDDPLKPDKEFVSEHGVYDKYSTPLNKKIRLNNDLKEVYKSRSQQTEGFYSDSYIIPKCQIGDRGLYIDASGILYPCCWFGYPHDHYMKEGQTNIWLKHKEQFDLSKRSLEEVLNSETWQLLFNTWKTKESCFHECENKCQNQSPRTLNMRKRNNANSLLNKKLE